MAAATSSPAILGIDIGGTKLAVGVVSPSGEILAHARQPTPQDHNADALFATVVALARQVQDAAPVACDRIGVGCGGPMRYPQGIVSPLHIPAWRDFPLRDRLHAEFGVLVVVDNDAKAFALGEACFGAGQSANYMLGMILSTGVGGGFVFKGRLFHGASGNAGHIGHTIVAPDGLYCECGAHGCLTVVASGTGLAQRAREAVQQGDSGMLTHLTPEAITGQAIVAAAGLGDPLALRLLHSAADGVACAIADAAVMFDLDTVVLGGGLIQAGALLLDPIKAALHERMRLSFTAKLAIHTAALGQTSGMIGAAALALAR